MSAQDSSLLPENFDRSKRNVVIFNSSEDEFISVGREFDKYKIFETQLDGIIAILDKLKGSDINVFLRIHPNLTTVKTKEIDVLLGLDKRYENLTVIPPASKVSTYSLIKNADKVVTFGSTVGVEAVYWGTPSILLGASFYRNLGCCYVPKTLAEAIKLLKVYQ